MKLSSNMKSMVCLALLVFMVKGCRPKSPEIPFDARSAAAHVRPYKVLQAYIDSFQIKRTRLYERVKDPEYIDSSFDLPNAEMFNRDAIIALLNAPGAKGIQIYLGRKTSSDTSNGNVVFVLLPVDEKGNDIKTKLLVNDQRTGSVRPGVSTAQVTQRRNITEEAEGVEDGQRCPSVCSDF
ncbi:hypothetical protein EXU57_02315 [Segetibacter sp. 3557_3]|uniref:hypothetical protein n=1 Tax=Segetibacter sp. 3557_3 TaxID=2547429 RepID=UPI0010584C8A|nr:hypothetical protein [Segetibacter sp. 3557_3]TDH28928.1 hypothetical protein EXU57_02315 [Segetibacter sp. 3557_3]